MEDIVAYLSTLDPIWVYAAVGVIAFVENIFPPFPSDVLVVAAGSFSAADRVDPVVTILIATAGSTLGFVTMYVIGRWFGRRILDAGRISFLPADQIARVEQWFRRFGYTVVVANRFLAGTRAVVSFFAGISDLKLLPCIVLSGVSALVWNTLLIIAGYELGANWRIILSYLQTYGEIMTGGIVLIGLCWLGVRWMRKRSLSGQDEVTP